ncbi:MAG TPA: hypothetical protein VE685_10045 [Thermoanaerobaculia bacterium]|nr:hypothetical protein [Thermoanaerobaculia bacterium]
MKNLLRVVMVFALVAIVLPLSSASAGKKNPGVAAYNPFNDLTCEITCSNGDHASKTVDTRGGCLDACEEFCDEQCVLVDN